jgi:hypothetical protein
MVSVPKSVPKLAGFRVVPPGATSAFETFIDPLRCRRPRSADALWRCVIVLSTILRIKCTLDGAEQWQRAVESAATFEWGSEISYAHR